MKGDVNSVQLASTTPQPRIERMRDERRSTPEIEVWWDGGVIVRERTHGKGVNRVLQWLRLRSAIE